MAPQNHFLKQHLFLSTVLLVGSLFLGCQHRAQTDIYVDSMAAEIRDLEDQLYLYDHETRLLEQEVESLRRRNASIIAQPGVSSSKTTPPVVLPEESPFEFFPQQTSPDGVVLPENIAVPTPEIEPVKSNPPTESGTGSGGTTSESLPSIMTAPTPSGQNPGQNVEGLPPPGVRPAFPPDNNGPQPESSGKNEFEFNTGELEVPLITTGALAPPSIDPKSITVSPDRDLELSLTQIEIPSQLANRSSNSARISSAVQVVSDKRVVELAFNPALTRAISFDDDSQDDGLYVVLQPRNEQGQVVAIAAAVSVEVLDPSRDISNTIIGQWHYTASEVQGKIQPMGSKQGIHLTLPWNGPNPKSDRVTVVATYQFENGRKLVARKEIYLNNASGLKTVWTPRAGGLNAASSSGGSVVSASANIPTNHGTPQPVQSIGIYAAPEAAPLPNAATNGTP